MNHNMSAYPLFSPYFISLHYDIMIDNNFILTDIDIKEHVVIGKIKFSNYDMVIHFVKMYA